MLDREQPNPDLEPDQTQPSSRRAYMRQYQKELRTRRKRLELSLDPEDYDRLKQEAQRHDMKLATFTREAVFAYLDSQYILPNPEQVRELELALRQIGNDISQIAHYANSRESEQQIDLPAIGRLLAKLEEEISQALRHPEKQ